ncbi:hypothetical protein LCGC14_2149940 [marine sediment metagenome]|uniref:Uncharacterized protein n=1 Tax=marine sediment metagenome TaxID=412755 RepID=A0A0F9DVP1_9ZZZZ
MSTSYYKLKEPFTSIRLTEIHHDHLTLWEDGENVGTLLLSKGTGKKVSIFFADADIPFAPVYTAYGGDGVGMVVTVPSSVPEDEILISEHGDITTLAKLRKETK